MKKTMFLGIVCIMTACLAVSTIQANAQKKDEDAIKKVLQEETTNYFHKNYDGWANTWAHDSADYILRTGANNFQELRGWNVISKEYQQDIKNMTPLDDADIATYLNKYDFQFYINGNLATVRFKEGNKNPDNTETRTLVKQNGAWKILNYVLIDGGSYAMQDIINNMKAMTGKWELDGRDTSEPASPVELQTLKFDLESTPNGLEQSSEFRYLSHGQLFAPPAVTEYFVPDYNSTKIIYMSIEKNHQGQTYTNTGTVTSDKPHSFTVTAMYPEKPKAKQTEYTVTLENGKWHQVAKIYDINGKQTNTITINLKRAE